MAFDPEKAQRIVDAIANGVLLDDVCAELGINRTTAWRWQQAEPEFATQCARAREMSADVVEQDVVRLLGEVKSGVVAPDAARVILNGQTWLAKVRAPKRYGERTSHEHSGPEGGAIPIGITVNYVGQSTAAGGVSLPAGEEG